MHNLSFASIKSFIIKWA